MAIYYCLVLVETPECIITQTGEGSVVIVILFFFFSECELMCSRIDWDSTLWITSTNSCHKMLCTDLERRNPEHKKGRSISMLMLPTSRSYGRRDVPNIKPSALIVYTKCIYYPGLQSVHYP